MARPKLNAPLEDPRRRIKRGIRVDANGCWVWQRAKLPTGYGRFSMDGKGTYAHRAAYELWRGPIGPGLQIDHLCRVVACVNPDHLEAVTPQVNVLRSRNPAALNAVKTHCKRGHEFDLINTYVHAAGKRDCRTCRALALREYRQRLAAKAA